MNLFDQNFRELVYALAEVAGMPKRVLEPYKRFQEALMVHTALANSIGMPYRRGCSIPQGCPLSMMIVALMMRPWVMMLRAMRVEAKVFADDVYNRHGSKDAGEAGSST